MISPTAFREDAECASDNAFQSSPLDEELDVAATATLEFDACRKMLEDVGVVVKVFEGSPSCPSAVFPNNWFSTHDDGTLVLYPMRALSRRMERRQEIIDWLLASYPSVLDLTSWEDRGLFLEGTGSLVLDRVNRIAFAAESPRTDAGLFRNWCADMEYEAVLFQTSGPGGLPIYHTNVVLSLGTKFAVLCTEAVLQPSHLISAILSTGREIIEITSSQMASFCANCLEIPSRGEKPLLALSQTAHSAFRHDQLEKLQGYVELLPADVPTLEKYGGGSVRCMLAELA